ncbi:MULTISPECIES: murein hydrolase activator EnvC family protein [Butyricimonas]|uniref:murein hydrolase activator EnvC family protein n=1 Tax=Butyricimonas TaxID=574697 RepID=UPI001D08FAC9|nr:MULTISPECIES: peptidoglycan DD-metalloendopeptidase family protein [Butyricimonas]MCB6974559.1 peptidoglycan DD-metalloendopeptidase family protein [Butyricimonas synergistica]MCG4518319.1 peptidoglycan DD-metalloendopeptidase family protein [Butyricimonas sp. DFI.6.44]
MNVFRVILILIFSFTFTVAYTQSIEAIKKKNAKTEKEIAYLNKLLDNARNDQSATIQKITIINQKIVKGKEMIQSLTNEVKYIEKQISSNEYVKSDLEASKQQMLDFYAKMVYETWKKRNTSDKLVYIFSSSSFTQAYARYKYFEQVQDYSKRQLERIKQTNDSLTSINNQLTELMALKNATQSKISAQNNELIKEQNQANKYVGELKKKEKEILRKLNIEIKNRERFKNELEKLIAAQAKKSGSKNSNYKLTPEEKLISDDFAKNKGKLPWPVEQGFVSEKFGVNIHPVFKQVKLNNAGITITTSRNADVRAVFKGVVTEIMFIPGDNNVVIVRHGNYLTVYSNLVEIFIKKGDTVNVKQKIGKLASSGENSTLNFQVWKDKDNMDPQLWLTPW